MTKITLAAYRFFKKHRAAFYFILIGGFLLFAFLASKMFYEEDISKLLPTTKNNEGAKYAFNKLKIKDKIFLEFIKNSPDVSDDDLIEATDSFCKQLMCKGEEEEDLLSKRSSDIENILYNIDNSLLADVANFISENAPIFLPYDIYDKIDNLLKTSSLDSLMNKNVSLLESESGSFYYDIICADPLSFRDLAIGENFEQEKGGENQDGFKIINGHFFAPDSSMTLAFITPSFKAMDSQAGTRLVDYILYHKENFEKANPNISIKFFGAPVQSVFNAKRIKKDLASTVSIALILIALIIGICMKGFRSILYLLLPIIYGVVFAIAMLYLIQGQMSFIALGIGCIVVGVALSYCLHITTHYKYVSDKEQLIKDQTKPILLGCITTVGSLLGLIFTKSALLRDFGIMSSLVMIGTTLFALFFLPQFLSSSHNKKNNRAFAQIEKITTYPYTKKIWIIITVVIIFIGSIIYTKGKANFDSDITNIGYFEKDVKFADSLYSQKIDNGMLQEFFAVHSTNLDSALIFNSEIESICQKLKHNNIIANYTNTSSILLSINQQDKKITKWQDYFTSQKVEEVKSKLNSAAQRAGLDGEMFEPFYNILSKKFSTINILEAQIIPDAILSNFIEKTDDTYLIFTSIKAESKEKIKKASNIIAYGDKDINNRNLLVVNPFFYTTDMLEIMNHDFSSVLFISSIFVFFILLITMRNLGKAIIAFLPMGMSWYIVLGVMAIFGVKFNLINIVISTFIFGMGVDYSIFVMDGLMHPEREQLLKYHRSAIFFSAVVLIIAVTSLMFAKHPAISSIGLSTLAGMISTIVITFTLQPYLYNKFYNKKSC